MEHNELRFVLERRARLQLQQLIADGNTPQKIVKRARIVLMTADGHGVMAIMREVGVSKPRFGAGRSILPKPVSKDSWKVAPNRPAGNRSVQ